jgi:hypothetical protein
MSKSRKSLPARSNPSTQPEQSTAQLCEICSQISAEALVSPNGYLHLPFSLLYKDCHFCRLLAHDRIWPEYSTPAKMWSRLVQANVPMRLSIEISSLLGIDQAFVTVTMASKGATTRISIVTAPCKQVFRYKKHLNLD